QAYSRDAAQHGFYTACKLAKACQAAGLDTRYPDHRKRWRTTVWKASGIRRQDGALRLARARGQAPVPVPLPPQLLSLPAAALREGRLGGARVARGAARRLAGGDRGRCAARPTTARRGRGSEVAGLSAQQSVTQFYQGGATLLSWADRVSAPPLA